MPDDFYRQAAHNSDIEKILFYIAQIQMELILHNLFIKIF